MENTQKETDTINDAILKWMGIKKGSIFIAPDQTNQIEIVRYQPKKYERTNKKTKTLSINDKIKLVELHMKTGGLVNPKNEDIEKDEDNLLNKSTLGKQLILNVEGQNDDDNTNERIDEGGNWLDKDESKDSIKQSDISEQNNDESDVEQKELELLGWCDNKGKEEEDKNKMDKNRVEELGTKVNVKNDAKEWKEKKEREIKEQQKRELNEKKERELKEKVKQDLIDKKEKERRNHEEKELKGKKAVESTKKAEQEKKLWELKEQAEKEWKRKKERELKEKRAKQEKDLKEKHDKELLEKKERERKEREQVLLKNRVQNKSIKEGVVKEIPKPKWKVQPFTAYQEANKTKQATEQTSRLSTKSDNFIHKSQGKPKQLSPQTSIFTTKPTIPSRTNKQPRLNNKKKSLKNQTPPREIVSKVNCNDKNTSGKPHNNTTPPKQIINSNNNVHKDWNSQGSANKKINFNLTLQRWEENQKYVKTKLNNLKQVTEQNTNKEWTWKPKINKTSVIYTTNKPFIQRQNSFEKRVKERLKKLVDRAFEKEAKEMPKTKKWSQSMIKNHLDYFEEWEKTRDNKIKTLKKWEEERVENQKRYKNFTKEKRVYTKEEIDQCFEKLACEDVKRKINNMTMLKKIYEPSFVPQTNSYLNIQSRYNSSNTMRSSIRSNTVETKGNESESNFDGWIDSEIQSILRDRCLRNSMKKRHKSVEDVKEELDE